MIYSLSEWWRNTWKQWKRPLALSSIKVIHRSATKSSDLVVKQHIDGKQIAWLLKEDENLFDLSDNKTISNILEFFNVLKVHLPKTCQMM